MEGEITRFIRRPDVRQRLHRDTLYRRNFYNALVERFNALRQRGYYGADELNALREVAAIETGSLFENPKLVTPTDRYELARKKAREEAEEKANWQLAVAEAERGMIESPDDALQFGITPKFAASLYRYSMGVRAAGEGKLRSATNIAERLNEVLGEEAIIRGQLEDLAQLFAAGVITKEQYATRRAELTRQREELVARRREIENAARGYSPFFRYEEGPGGIPRVTVDRQAFAATFPWMAKTPVRAGSGEAAPPAPPAGLGPRQPTSSGPQPQEAQREIRGAQSGTLGELMLQGQKPPLVELGYGTQPGTAWPWR